MPIRAERRHLYPANWKTEIVPMIRARSGDSCETCGVKNKSWVARTPSGNFFAHTHEGLELNHGAVVFKDKDGKASVFAVPHLDWLPPVRIILTVAHLNHDETDNRPENLAHLCQLHHNRHDAAHRASTRRRKKEPA